MIRAGVSGFAALSRADVLSYRRHIDSVLPVVLSVALTSQNLAGFHAAVSDVAGVARCRARIRADADDGRGPTQHFELARLKELNCHPAKP